MLSKYIAIFLWLFLIGIVAVHVFGLPFGLGYSQTSEFTSLVGKSIDTEGYIEGLPSITSSGNLSLMLKIDGYNQLVGVSIKTQATYKAKDRVWVRGIIKQPENFSGFNYVAYLKKNNVYAQLDKPKIILLNHGKEDAGSKLEKIRQWVIKQSRANLNETSSGLVLGMLIGFGDDVPKDLANAFKKTGLTHILVASGFNLTIIASSIGFFAYILGRKGSDLFSIVIIWVFVLLTGSSGSVVRAGIMTSLVLLARGVGRMPTSYFTLLFAVAVMVFINPLQLFYDIGFQLSVGATIGVLEANKLRIELQKEGVLVDLLWPTVGAIIFTAPIIAFYFGTFSVIAPLANLVVLPFVSVVMLLGGLSLFPYAQNFTVPITELIVGFQEKATVLLSNWKYSSVNIKVDLVLVLAYYVVLFVTREAYYYKKIEK